MGFVEKLEHAFEDLTAEKWQDNQDTSSFYADLYADWEKDHADDYDLEKDPDTGELIKTPEQEDEIEMDFCAYELGNRIEEFWNNFDGEEEGNGILIYRAITVPDPDEFIFMVAHGEQVSPEFKGLGIYWSWSPRGAEAHWGGGGQTVVLTAWVSDAHINFEQTAIANTHLSMADEKEVTLKEGAPIRLLSVDVSGEKVEVDTPEGYLELTASVGKYPTLKKVLAVEDNQFSIRVEAKGKTKKDSLEFRKENGDEGLEFIIKDTKTKKDIATLSVAVEDIDGDDPYMFEPYKDEKFYEDIIDHATVVAIQNLEVDPDYQGKGLATKLYDMAIKEVKKHYSGYPIYINASPMGSVGLSLEDLINFYKKAGFKVLKKYPEDRNALLWLDDTKKLKSVASLYPTLSKVLVRWK